MKRADVKRRPLSDTTLLGLECTQRLAELLPRLRQRTARTLGHTTGLA